MFGSCFAPGLVVLKILESWANPKNILSFLSSICQNIEFIFPLPKYLGRLPFLKKIEVAFHLKKSLGCLQFLKIWGSVVFLNNYGLCSIFEIFEVLLHFKHWCILPFWKIWTEVVFHFLKTIEVVSHIWKKLRA